MKKVSLCVDARLIQASGIGTFLKSMLQALSESTFTYFLLHWKKDKEYLARFRPSRLIEVSSPLYSLKEQLELPLKIPQCDLFWAPHFNVPLLPIRAKKRLTTLHDAFHLAHFSSLSFFQKRYAKTVFKAACHLSDQLTTVSFFSKAEILKYCPFSDKKLTTIPFGVSAHFCPKREEKGMRLKYCLPEKYLLAITNFKPHKNFERVLKACQDILPLIVIGKECKGVATTGYVEDEDMPFLYSHAEALVFPSLYEGFGCPPLEAMACGCPAIVSDLPVFREVCEDAAEYVDPLDVCAIRQGVLHVLNNSQRKKTLIEKGFALSERKKAETSARKHLELMESLL